MNDCNRHEHDCEHEHGHGHGCDGCVSVEALRSISQKYQGIENDVTENGGKEQIPNHRGKTQTAAVS